MNQQQLDRRLSKDIAGPEPSTASFLFFSVASSKGCEKLRKRAGSSGLILLAYAIST